MSTFYDIVLNSDGDLPRITRHSKGSSVILQRVKFRLSTFLGEWVLDTEVGLPFHTWLQQKPPDTEAIGARIRSEILDTPGVSAITRFEAEFLEDELRLVFRVALTVEESETAYDLEIYPGGVTNANSTPAVLLLGRSRSIAR